MQWRGGNQWKLAAKSRASTSARSDKLLAPAASEALVDCACCMKLRICSTCAC